MQPINCFANIVGNNGYAIHARRFFTALDRLVPVCLVPKYGPLPDLNGTPFGPMLDRLATVNLRATSINLDVAEEMFRFGGDRRIGFTVFEAERLSAAAIHQLRQLDQVWVPTQWGRSILIQNGVPAERIRIVPEGIDPAIFHPDLPAYPELTQLGGFRFLVVAKWEARKGLPELLRAFDRAFTPDDPVWLIAHCASTLQGLKDIDVNAEIDKLGLQMRAKIVAVGAPLSTDEQIARLYSSCDAVVTATKAEGWGLPLTEAMACGRPVIAPFYSGQTEFLTDANSYPFPVTALDDIYCPIFFPERGAHGRWAHIDIDTLAATLRHVFTHPEEAAARGAIAADEMRARWTWDHAARIAMEHLANC